MLFLIFLQFAQLSAPACHYFTSINQAELSITDHKYSNALQYYNAAFAKQPTPMGQDLYNAAICAMRAGNNAQAFAWCLQLAEKGVPLTFFEQKASFASLRRDTRWTAFVTDYRSKARTFRQRNQDALTFLEGLLAASSQANDFNRGHDPREPMPNRLSWVNDSLAQVLTTYMQQRGYLSEEQIGISIEQDTLLKGYPRFAPIFYRRHPLVNPALNAAYLQLLQTGINQIKLKPDFYLDLMRRTISYKEENILGYYSRYGNSLYCTTAIAEPEADAYRIALGQSKLKDYLKIVLFTFRHPGDFSFNQFATQQKSSRADKQEEAIYKSNHKLIIKDITQD